MDRLLLLIGLLGLVGCAAAPNGVASNRIEGRVLAQLDGRKVPLPQASVRVTPEDSPLIGVAVTNSSGFFAVDALNNPETFATEGLAIGHAYLVEVTVPEFYVATRTVQYDGKVLGVDILLEQKTQDLDDAPPAGSTDDEPVKPRGSAPKKG